ncbi:MAG: glycosyltransferase WbuB [Thermoleophilia bacterium]|nr:glycosyltransferase WbuB [Thermoleophilia bacterium]
MARVLYVSQYFVSADQPGGVRHWQHARALARAGHDVTVVTSYVQHKERVIPEEFRGKRIVHTREDGLDVIRTYSTPGYGRDLRSRMANYGTFAMWSFLAEARLPRPDVVVASSPSLPAAAAAAALAQARRSRFLLEIRDLWPDSAIAMGLVGNRAIIAAARKLERYCYRRADHIVALTGGIRDSILCTGISADRVSLITNGVDLDVVPDPDVPSGMDIPEGTFVAMYVGAHGTYSSLGTVLEAAHLLRDDPGIRIVFVGGGDQKPALLAQAAAGDLPNVVFVDPVPKRQVPTYLAAADLCLLPYQDRALFAGALPNKVFDYLAAARPILAAAPRGELTDLVDRTGCGWVVPPEDPAAMAVAIRGAADHRDAARARGEAGRAYAIAEYDRAALAARFVAIVDELAAGGAGRRR